MILGTVFFISFYTSLVRLYIYTHNTMKGYNFLHQSFGINNFKCFICFLHILDFWTCCGHIGCFLIFGHFGYYISYLHVEAC